MKRVQKQFRLCASTSSPSCAVAFFASFIFTGCVSFDPIFHSPATYGHQTWKRPAAGLIPAPQVYPTVRPYPYAPAVVSPMTIESPGFGSRLPQSRPEDLVARQDDAETPARSRGSFYEAYPRQGSGPQLQRTLKPVEEESTQPLLPVESAVDPPPVPVTVADRPPRNSGRRFNRSNDQTNLRSQSEQSPNEDFSAQESDDGSTLLEAPSDDVREPSVDSTETNSDAQNRDDDVTPVDDGMFGGRLLGEIEVGPEAGPEFAPRNSELPRTLELKVSTAKTERVGNGVLFRVKLVNTGDEPVEGLVIACDFGKAFRFPNHREDRVEQPIPTLPPNGSKEIALTLLASRAGSQCCRFTIMYEGREVVWKSACVDLVE